MEKINKKLIKLNNKTDKSLEKLHEQDEQLKINNGNLTFMGLNLSYSNALLKSMKYKINPSQMIPDINFDFMKIKNMINKDVKNAKNDEDNEKVEICEDEKLGYEIMKNLDELYRKQLLINKTLDKQNYEIERIDNKVDRNKKMMRNNKNIIDDIL